MRRLPHVLSLLAAIALLTPLAAAGADPVRGQRVYLTHCVACHGPGGIAVAQGAPSFARGERLAQPDIMLLQSVRGGRNAMPPFIGLLSDQQILDALLYIRTLR